MVSDMPRLCVTGRRLLRRPGGADASSSNRDAYKFSSGPIIFGKRHSAPSLRRPIEHVLAMVFGETRGDDIIRSGELRYPYAYAIVVLGVGDLRRARLLAILSEPRSRLFCGIVTRDPAKAAPYGVKSWSDLTVALEQCGTRRYVAALYFAARGATVEARAWAAPDALCEKPMALNSSDAVSHAARFEEESRRTLGIAYSARYVRAGAVRGNWSKPGPSQPGVHRGHGARFVDPIGAHRARSPTRSVRRRPLRDIHFASSRSDELPVWRTDARHRPSLDARAGTARGAHRHVDDRI